MPRRASRSSGGFRERLADLRRCLAPYAGRGSGVFHPVIIRPALAWSLVPKPRQRVGDAAATLSVRQRDRLRIARLLGGEGAPPSGLVEGSQFDATGSDQSSDGQTVQVTDAEGHRRIAARYGMRGLTGNGAKKIEDFCRLVKQDGSCYGIWTVTLPPELAAELDRIPDGCQRFGDAIRRRFSEALQRACRREAARCRTPISASWCYVVEPQQSGRPHWHYVFRCKARRGRPWLLGKHQLDRLIRNAAATVTGGTYRTLAAGNVQALRKDPGSYLSSYLKKSASANAALVLLANGYSENLIPHQWWGMSREALHLVEHHRFELPSCLVGWLSRQWPGLRGIGLLEAQVWTPEAEGAPSMVVGSWRSIEDAIRCIRHLADLAERGSPAGITFGRT